MAKRQVPDDERPRSTPDEIEQQLLADGSVEEDEAVGPVEVLDGADEPLTPDMIEQRQIVEYDEDEDRPVE